MILIPCPVVDPRLLIQSCCQWKMTQTTQKMDCMGGVGGAGWREGSYKQGEGKADEYKKGARDWEEEACMMWA